jgi:hypothetical protein
VILDVDGGDMTLTVTGGYNQPGNTSITMDDAGDFATFMSVDIGGSYYWRQVAKERKLVVTSSTPSSTPSHTSS